VAGVTYSENGIFSGTESASTITPEGFTATSEEDTLSAMDDVGPGYFRTIGARLLRGRDIEASDGESAPKVAVVNETFARFYFKDQNPIGKHFTVDSSTYEIVGVAADVRDHSLREPPERRFYAPMAQWAGSPDLLDFELRTTGDPALVAQAVRRELRAAEPTLTIYSVEPLVSLMKESITQQRLVAQLSSFFGALAIALAAIGLYGVMSYTIVRRTSEFGLRAALGALPADVSRMVLRETLGVVLLGIVVGAVPALAVARLLRHQLFGVSVLDPLSIGVALAVLLTAALLAGLMPAARASRVAPLVALRAD
jgi:predicted permease